MGTREEAIVRSLVDRLNADDRDAIAYLYAEDAVWHMSAWRDPIIGRAAIRDMLDKLAGDSFQYAITNIASTNDVVFTEIIDTHNRNGNAVTMHWSSVVEIDPSGKIANERDYWDSAELESQLAERKDAESAPPG
jgi:limonene-1,2-epoxide hydrolase